MAENGGSDMLSIWPVFGTAINAWSKVYSMEENANQARIQRQWNEKMWERNNEYNRPALQKARLEEAGINPYSVMAQGGANTGVSSSPADSYERANIDTSSPFDADQMMNSIVMSRQLKALDLENQAKGINNEFLHVKNVKELLDMDAEIGLKIAQKEEHHENAEYLYWLRETTRESLNSVVKKLENDAKQSEINADNLQYRIDLDNALSRVEIRLRQSGIAVNNKTLRKLQSDIETNETIQGYYNSMSTLNKEQINNLVSSVANDVRNRVSSRFHDELDAKKASAEITISVLRAFMDANSGKLGNLELREFQTSVMQALRKEFGDIVPESTYEQFEQFTNKGNHKSSFGVSGGGVR